MLFLDGQKVKIKLMHNGELMAGINERLRGTEMNTVLILTQEENDDKQRRETEKEQHDKDTSKKKGKKGEEEKKSKYVYYLGGECSYLDTKLMGRYIMYLKNCFYYQRIYMRQSLVQLSTKR